MLFLKALYFFFNRKVSNLNYIVIFPGFGILPESYDEILPRRSKKIHLGIWTNKEYANITNVGYPGTQSYEDWFQRKTEKCLEYIKEQLPGDEDRPNVVFFGHSIGAEIAHRIESHADSLITYGCFVNSKKPILNLLGTNDKIAFRYPEKWPSEATLIQDANHFSCLNNKEAIDRSLKWRDKVNSKVIEETPLSKTEAERVFREIYNKISDFLITSTDIEIVERESVP